MKNYLRKYQNRNCKSWWINTYFNHVLKKIIFAGLVTGIVISLISAIKSMTLYRTEYLIEWLDSLHRDILEYIGMYRKMVCRNQNDFDDDTLYDHIYGTLCCGNNINVTISQERFNNSLPFDSYKYMKEKFGYDAMNCSENNACAPISPFPALSPSPKKLRRMAEIIFFNACCLPRRISTMKS